MSILSANRSCPQCGAGVGKTRLWVTSTYWSHWKCPACETPLGIDKPRRIVLTIIALPFFALWLLLAMNHEWVLALCALIPWLAIWRFDSLKVVESHHNGKANSHI